MNIKGRCSLMLPDLPGSFFAVTRTTSRITQAFCIQLTAAGEPQKSRIHLLFVGEHDFAGSIESAPVWMPYVLPTIVCLTELGASRSNPAFRSPVGASRILSALSPGDHILRVSGVVLRLHISTFGIKTYGVALPLDRLFEYRVAAAMNVWRWLSGRTPVPLQMMPLRQRKRLILALRVLDGRLSNASYREIADALFGLGDAAGRAWKNHDLRDRTIRIARLGTSMMTSGYKQLLAYPYRCKLP
jgi:hypothetical protein